MNKAKKIMKNEGLKNPKELKKQKIEADADKKNLILAILGIVIVLGLVGAVCFITFRPRAIIKVKTVSDGSSYDINLTDAMYDIYNVENQYNNMSSIYEQIYGQSYWDMEDVDGAGTSGVEAAKKEVSDKIKDREVLVLAAKKDGISLTDEENKKVDTDTKTFIDGLSPKQKGMAGLDTATVKKIIEKQAIADKYKEKIIADAKIDEAKIKAGVKKEDFRQYNIQYYTFPKKTTDDSGSNSKAKTKKEIEEGLKNIKLVAEKAKKAKDFTKGIITDSDNNQVDDKTKIEYQTAEVVESETDLPKKVVTQIKKMKNNEISGIVDADEGYYVIKMTDNNNSAAYEKEVEEKIQTAKDTAYENGLKELKKEYKTSNTKYWKDSSIIVLGQITYDAEYAEEQQKKQEEAQKAAESASGSAASGTSAE